MVSVEAIPCLSDNYAYLVIDSATGEAAVVDPSEARPVMARIRSAGAKVGQIWCTHHHGDHVGGVEEIAGALRGLRVLGHASDRGRIPAQTDYLEDGSAIRLGDARGEARHVPGHTLGAVAYVVGGVAFTGDTLFGAGCGRLFEGTAAMMHRSLGDRLATLPPETLVYCGHEYTVQNLLFADAMEPGSAAVEARLARARAARERGEPTVPSTMGEEMATNPFLRCPSATIRRSVGLDASATDAEVFAAVRARKDVFRG